MIIQSIAHTYSHLILHSFHSAEPFMVYTLVSLVFAAPVLLAEITAFRIWSPSTFAEVAGGLVGGSRSMGWECDIVSKLELVSWWLS